MDKNTRKLRKKTYLKYCSLFDTFIYLLIFLFRQSHGSYRFPAPKLLAFVFSFFGLWPGVQQPSNWIKHISSSSSSSSLSSAIHLQSIFLASLLLYEERTVAKWTRNDGSSKNSPIAFFWASKKAIDYVWTQESDRPKNRPSLFLGKR